MFGHKKNLFFALSILIGTIVGAGIFGIPYVVAKSGLIPSFFYLLILGGTVLCIHLLFGEIVLRTKEKHRLPGFSQKYLGKKGTVFIAISVMVGLTGALLAYVIIGGDFLKIVFSPILDLPSFYFSLFFLAFLSYFIFRGTKLIAPTELVSNSLFFIIIFIIFCFALPEINLDNYTLINPQNIFLPFGVIMFSLIGFSAVPEMAEVLGTPEEKKNLKKVMITTFFTVAILYILFALVVVGVSGEGTSPETFQGLIPFLGYRIILFGALAAVITLADSFLVIGLYLRNILIYDYGFSKLSSVLFACGLPLILFLAGFRSFITTISFIGTIVGVIEGIIIILVFKQAKKLGDRMPEYDFKAPSVLLYFLMLVLILGAIFQIWA